MMFSILPKVLFYFKFLGQHHTELFPKRQIDSSKLKDCADEISEFDEYGGKFSKKVENTVGKKTYCRRVNNSMFGKG